MVGEDLAMSWQIAGRELTDSRQGVGRKQAGSWQIADRELTDSRQIAGK
jgi:hypothetical protein